MEVIAVNLVGEHQPLWSETEGLCNDFAVPVNVFRSVAASDADVEAGEGGGACAAQAGAEGVGHEIEATERLGLEIGKRPLGTEMEHALSLYIINDPVATGCWFYNTRVKSDQAKDVVWRFL